MVHCLINCRRNPCGQKPVYCATKTFITDCLSSDTHDLINGHVVSGRTGGRTERDTRGVGGRLVSCCGAERALLLPPPYQRRPSVGRSVGGQGPLLRLPPRVDSLPPRVSQSARRFGGRATRTRNVSNLVVAKFFPLKIYKSISESRASTDLARRGSSIRRPAYRTPRWQPKPAKREFCFLTRRLLFYIPTSFAVDNGSLFV